MKCHIDFSRLNADTISGERLIVTYTYSTFDSIEMDKFEEGTRENIGSGITLEFEPYAMKHADKDGDTDADTN